MIKIKFVVMMLVLASVQSFHVFAQQVHEPQNMNSQWSQPYPPFRIAGNLYYVGTYDLACYLIVTSEGSLLINTGLAASASIIMDNIKSLGFNTKDIKIMLTTQAHFDHVGAMKAIKKLTGARFWADEKDADALADGGSSDYELGQYGITFEPIEVDHVLHDRDTITLGTTKLILLHHPGHTKGSCSYLLDTDDGRKTYRVLIANLPSIITDKKFTDIQAYPDIAKDYAYTLNAMKKLSFDLWLSSHASQFGLHKKHKPGDAYHPEVFMDRRGYDQALDELESEYLKKLKQE